MLGVSGANPFLANLMNLVFLIWPCIAIIYSYCLYKMACLSWPLVVVNAEGNEEELRRLENRLNERRDDLRQ